MCNRTEIHIIKKSDDLFKIIDDLCWRSKNLYNYANYMVRQEFINTSKEKEQGLRKHAVWIKYQQLCKDCKTADCYKAMKASSSQKTLKLLDKDWKSFFEAIKIWKTNPEKFTGRPKLPGYKDKEHGRANYIITNQSCRIIDGYLFFSSRDKSMESFNHRFKTHIPENAKLMQVRFHPNKDAFPSQYDIEVVYEIECPEPKKDTDIVAAIDIGVDNFMTVVTNQKDIVPIVINGRKAKAMNQEYNKLISEEKSRIKLRHNLDWSNECQRLTDRRVMRLEDFYHKATTAVAEFCLKNNVSYVVCGHNLLWKQNCDMGKVNNQNFVYLGHTEAIKKLTYKMEDRGIRFHEFEESYTSGTSFLDDESPNPENYNKNRRVHRGLFQSNNGEYINADVNGAYQIMKKVFPNMFANGTDGYPRHPRIINVI